MTAGSTLTRSNAVGGDVRGLPRPPDDETRDAYLGSQQRWLIVLQTLSFIGICVSIYGFSRMSYWTLIFDLPLAIMIVEMVLSARTAGYRRRWVGAAHRSVVQAWKPTHHPSIDIFLPSAGEPLVVLRNTYRYVREIRWPGDLKIFVLDDSDNPGVRELALEFGFEYAARPDNLFKKAGNLQYGLGLSHGDFIAILDADFVPRDDIAAELMPYFDDETVAIVQSPQHFTTSPQQSWLERAAGATQELFYRFVQPSRDAVDAAICVGTSAFYRRSALETIGGFPQVAHSEDVFTGVELAKVGYVLRYVPVIVSTGTCPQELSAFVGQQYRWCEGSVELALDRTFHENPNIGVRQRLCFWSGFLYYMSTALTVYVAPLPALAMVWFLPDRISSVNVLPLTGAALLWLVVYPLVFTSRWRVEVLRVQVIYSFAHALAIFDVYRARESDWVPTGGSTRHAAATTVRRTILLYLVPAQILLVVGLVDRTRTYGLGAFWTMIAFAAINAYVFVPVIAIAARESWAVWVGARRHQPRHVPAGPARPPQPARRARPGPGGTSRGTSPPTRPIHHQHAEPGSRRPLPTRVEAFAESAAVR